MSDGEPRMFFSDDGFWVDRTKKGPEPKTFDEVLISEVEDYISSLESENATLRAEVERFKQDHIEACCTIAKMHEAAVGEVTGPRRGVVEDVADAVKEQADLVMQVLEESVELRAEVEHREKYVAFWHGAHDLKYDAHTVETTEAVTQGEELLHLGTQLREALKAVREDIGRLPMVTLLSVKRVIDRHDPEKKSGGSD